MSWDCRRIQIRAIEAIRGRLSTLCDRAAESCDLQELYAMMYQKWTQSPLEISDYRVMEYGSEAVQL